MKEFKYRDKVCQGRYVWQCMKTDSSYCSKYPVGHDYFESYWELMPGYAKTSDSKPAIRPSRPVDVAPKEDEQKPEEATTEEP